MTEQILTAKELRDVVHYDADTGNFTRKDPKLRSCTGTIPKNPKRAYLNICINYKIYKAHRLAWLYIYGEWPNGQIDHINGDKLDNRILNLRTATNAQNKQNSRKARSDSKSGLLGATWYTKGNKWRASIQVDGKKKHLGYFATAEEAHDVFIQAKRKLHAFCTI